MKHRDPNVKKAVAAIGRFQRACAGLCKELEDFSVVLASLLGSLPKRNPLFERSNRLKAIQATVARRFNLTIPEMNLRTRKEEILWPRHLTILLSWKLTHAKPSQLARAFGYEHATIDNAIKSASNRIETDSIARAQYNELYATLLAKTGKGEI